MIMRIARLAGAFGVAAIFATVLSAQACPQGNVVLTVTPSASNLLAVSVTGTPGASVVLFRGHDLGQTTLSGGALNGTVLCLATPFIPIPLGQIPTGGTKTISAPSLVPIGSTVHFQAVTVVHSLSGSAITVDTSNVASFTNQPPPPTPCTPGNVQLTVTPDGQVQPGQTITVSVTGTPGAFVVLAASHSLGSTPLPFLSSPLCVGWPVVPLPFGVIPTSGTLTRTHTVPTGATLPGNVTIFLQAVTASPSTTGGMLVFDTSNTDSLML